MKLLKKLDDLKNKIYNFLTDPKKVIISIYASGIVFFSAIIIGVIVAQFDPDGYNFIDNYISDMGSFNHTPLPYFLDYGAMITSFLLIPMAFYMDKTLAPFPNNPDKQEKTSRLRLRLSSYALLFFLIGLVGFFSIGLFSEDRSDLLKPVIGVGGLHGLFSYVVFGGLVIAGIFLGLLIVLYRTIIPKYLGIYMIFIPPIPAILFLANIPPSQPFFEWLLLFSIFTWIIPVGLLLIKQAKEELSLI
ncbi:MAG: DUF998 domain-containing protein [Promethearchaeota archaeon]